MSEAAWRLTVFAGVFAALAMLELVRPRRAAALGRGERWPGGLMLFAIGAALSRLVAPLGLAGVALYAQAQGWGASNMVALPAWLAVVLAILVLDVAVWAQHVLMHKVDLLWRLHRVHHADPHVDVTTALRFHPVEILLSLGWKALVVVVLGVPALAAFLFEVILNASAQFNHANIALPRPLDRVLRAVVVTPDMHRVHHSVDPAEYNRNFGFFLSIWDRLFGLYRAQPAAGHTCMRIGQSRWRGPADQSIGRLLVQPLAPDEAEVRPASGR